MNLTHVQTFVVAVETGNLNRAAAKLNVTQSTVTARIDALENLIGQKLLHRNKSGTELTPAGAKFLRHAEMLVQVWKQARYETSLPRGFEDVLALACDPHLWTGIAELWVRDLRQARSTIAISVEDRPSPAMVDIVFSYTPALSGFAVDVVGEDMFIEVATVPRGLMRWDPLYVYVDLGEDFRRQHTQAFPVDETAIVTFSSSAQALDHIMSCGGSAYLPYRVARPHMETGKLFEVSGAPRFTRTIYLGRNTARTEAWPWFAEFMQGFKQKLHSNIVIP
ncbi:MAG TPA: LysR family transcriptional regulator, partial [Nordella sp.]|nr:LysR family transcriptional regulator [Nordella sp.]